MANQSQDEFRNVQILNNFYQTSSFYPMPVVLMSTISESGKTNVAPYSLCFPYEVSGDHAMMLLCRSNSNTAINIKRTKTAAINFIPFDKKYLKNCVKLGFPGESTEEKMKNSAFTLLPSTREDGEKAPGLEYPEILDEAFQVFECTWDETEGHAINEDTIEERFVLRIDKILLKPKYYDALINDKKKDFPSMPIDYGFRNNVNFYFSKHKPVYIEPLPEGKEADVNVVVYQADRLDPDVAWEVEACAKLVKVPRIFLKRVMRTCVEKAKEKNVNVITPEFLDTLRDKRAEEKGSA